LAAADGVIVSTENRIGAAPFVGFGIVDVFARSLTGNRVIIRHAENEYGFYAHLIKGSVCVSVGEQVRRGQTIGRCGHSGHSSEPHLHFHVQDRENFFAAAGVPILFQDLAIDGEPIDAGQPRGRQRVRTLGATAMLRS
jgi:murein DD-endopeptidase MepM/ murein hydrolase activator NlpD